MTIEADVSGPVWRWPGDQAWHFLTLPADLSDDIRASVPPRGFGSVRVTASIGSTVWETSVFPDTKAGAFILPMKATVRRAHGIQEDDVVTVHLRVRD